MCYGSSEAVMNSDEVCVIPVRFADETLPGDDLLQKLGVALRHQKLALRNNDVVVVKHKIVSKAEGRIVPLQSMRPRKFASAWARRYGLDERVVELALREAKRF